MRVIVLGIENDDFAWEVFVAARGSDSTDYASLVEDDYPYSVASIVEYWTSHD